MKGAIRFTILLALDVLSSSCFGQIRLPRLVRDSMVLQRDREINIWGWAAPGEKIKVKFNRREFKTVGNSEGKWTVRLPPTKAGGPFTMDISGSNDIHLKEILVGDVWLCSGQSNMVHQMKLHADLYEDEIAHAAYPQIRQFWIPTATDLKKPREELPGGYWKAALPGDIGDFSAVAYFFSKTIYQKYHIPIGLINASVGGSPIEAWMSEEALYDFPEALKKLRSNKDTALVFGINRKAIAFNASRPRLHDKGLTNNPNWYDPSYNPKGWHSINVPGYWEDQGIKDLDGIVWYRKEIDVPQSMTGIPAKLVLGRIVDADFVYVNGVAAGNTGYLYPQRRYQLPAGLLKPGKNTIVVRVINNGGKGGFVSGKPYAIVAAGDSIDLRGEWQYKIGAVSLPSAGTPMPSITVEYQPAALFNAMIAPVVNYTIKGMLWYQGESNTGDATSYARLFPALISDWRMRWKEGDLPFLFVQLPGYGEVQYTPSESQWAQFRAAQFKTLSVPNTGMATAIDLGEWNDIHPANKKDVGTRLALVAEKVAYGEKNIVYTGPLYASAEKQGNKISIAFNATGSGLVANDGEALYAFTIAGSDRRFVPAFAIIEGDHVVVWNDGIQDPVFVRYAWADNPAGANLYNREGLPAAPFEAEAVWGLAANEKTEGPWQHKRCAVVLTYDDGLNVDLSNVIPALDSVGLKGTFYISDYFNGLSSQISGWKAAAANGHELANHTVHHPCTGNLPGREFVTADYDLNRYTIRRMTDEIRTMNNILKAIDGKWKRTFAFPCGDTKIHDTAYIDPLRNEFVAARGVRGEILTIDKVDLYNVPSFMINGQTGPELIRMVKDAMSKGGLIVFLFHGVGGEHALNVSLQAHTELLRFLKENEGGIWNTTMIEAGEYIKNYQSKK